jgi:hypothetical protein
MKSRVFLAVALIALTAAAVFAQRAEDFTTKESSVVRNGVTISGYTITGYTGTRMDVQIPLLINNKSVLGIGDGAFKNSKITSVTIQTGTEVATIGKNAFEGCTSLTSVTFDVKLDLLKTIEDQAFMGCNKLTSVTIPNGVISIGFQAFMNCTSIASVTLPASLTTIGDQAFISCVALTSLTIPNGVTKIGASSIRNCQKLATVTIPASVTSIGAGAFWGSTALTSVTFGGSIPLSNFPADAFNNLGDIRDKFYAANASGGTPGKYMRSSSTATAWAKQ